MLRENPPEIWHPSPKHLSRSDNFIPLLIDHIGKFADCDYDIGQLLCMRCTEMFGRVGEKTLDTSYTCSKAGD